MTPDKIDLDCWNVLLARWRAEGENPAAMAEVEGWTTVLELAPEDDVPLVTAHGQTRQMVFSLPRRVLRAMAARAA